MNLVSVIIPAYKPQHLMEALNSVFAQTVSDYELIVVNDGSPFGIRELLLPLVKAGRINYIEQHNLGVAAARNRGLREATGEFIAFLDDDDFWPSNKLEWQVDYLTEHPEIGMVLGGWAIVNEIGHIITEHTFEHRVLKLQDLIEHPGPTLGSPGQSLIRRNIIQSHNGFDETIWGADDYDLFLKIARTGKAIIAPSRALYYRKHPSNASNNPLLMCLNIQRVMNNHLSFLPRERRHRSRLAAARWLYNFRGETMIQEWKDQIISGEWRSSWKHLLATLWFFRAAVSNPTFTTTLAKQILPARFSTQ